MISLQVLILQIIAPVIEGSTLELDELTDLVEAKLKSSFEDQLEPYKEILRSTADIIQNEFNQVATLKPETFSKLEQLQIRVPLQTTIWQAKSIELLQPFYKPSDIKQLR